MTKEIWTSEDELEFQIGDMNGIAFEAEARQTPKNDYRKDKSVPIRIDKKPEVQKKHIKQTGKK